MAYARSKSIGRFHGCNWAQTKIARSLSPNPRACRAAARSTPAACAIHQSLSTEYGVRVIRSSAIPSERIRSLVPDDGTITWSAIRNISGHATLLNHFFQTLPSRASNDVASAPNKNAALAFFAALRAIQNDFRPYPVKQATASKFPSRINFSMPGLFSPPNPSSPEPLFVTCVHSYPSSSGTSHFTSVPNSGSCPASAPRKLQYATCKSSRGCFAIRRKIGVIYCTGCDATASTRNLRSVIPARLELSRSFSRTSIHLEKYSGSAAEERPKCERAAMVALDQENV